MKRQKDTILKDELPSLVGAQYATGEEWRNHCRENKDTEPKWKQCPVVDVTGEGRKVQCRKEQYCIGTWNVRSMNPSKLEVVKQETARVIIDIWGTSELQWTGKGEVNSVDHWIYDCVQESFRRSEVDIIVNKRVWDAVLGCNLKNNRIISFQFHQTIQHTVSKSMLQPEKLKKLKLNGSETYRTF